MGATNCPETPRQKMIGMMYLFLTCLLALNVSKDILDAFAIVNEGLVKTNINFNQKNGFTYMAFSNAYTNDPKKVEPYYNAANEVKKLADETDKYIYELKVMLTQEVEGLKEDKKTAEDRADNMMKMEAKDNRDIPHNLMLGESHDGSAGKARELKNKLIELKTKFIALIQDPKIDLPNKEIRVKELADLGINTDDNPNASPDKPEEKYWETSKFADVPMAAVITMLTQIQSQVRNAEATVINTLFSTIGATDLKFDAVAPRVIPKSNYLISGDKYEADLFIAAFSTTDTSSRVLIGDAYDTIKNELTGNVKEIPVVNGMGKYLVESAGVGPHSYGAIIRVFNATTGEYKNYPVKSGDSYKLEYMVAPPMAVVSPTKMNVLYIGVDNPIAISVPGFRDDQVSASISGGSIYKSGKEWIAKVSTPGRCNINVSAKDDKGNARSMGSMEFRVKRVPDPVPIVAGKKGGNIAKSLLAAQTGVIAALENFDFDLKFNVIGFTVSANIGGFTQDASSTSSRFTPEQLNLFNKVQKGKKVYIENVRAKGPDGTVRNLGAISFKID